MRKSHENTVCHGLLSRGSDGDFERITNADQRHHRLALTLVGGALFIGRQQRIGLRCPEKSGFGGVERPVGRKKSATDELSAIVVEKSV